MPGHSEGFEQFNGDDPDALRSEVRFGGSTIASDLELEFLEARLEMESFIDVVLLLGEKGHLPQKARYSHKMRTIACVTVASQ